MALDKDSKSFNFGASGVKLPMFGGVKPDTVATTSKATLSTLLAPSLTTSKGTGESLGALSGTLSGGVAANKSGAPATVTTTQSRGLGGRDPATFSTSNNTETLRDGRTTMENVIPQVLVNTVDEFKKQIREHRLIHDQLSRFSSKQMSRVQEEVKSLRMQLVGVSNSVQRGNHGMDKLKSESANDFRNTETAVRTRDIPPSLQYDHSAPVEYFVLLVQSFESRMTFYRSQIDNLETHLSGVQASSSISSVELAQILQKLHESFISLAAQLHAVHEVVQTQKELYLQYAKVYLGEKEDVFEKHKENSTKNSSTSLSSLKPLNISNMTNSTALAIVRDLAQAVQPTGNASMMGLLNATNTIGAPISNQSTNPGGQGATLGNKPMFGTPASSNTSNLFGNNASLFNVNQPQGGSLLGNTPASGPLFGGTNQTASNSLFGGGSSTGFQLSANQTAPAGSLFGTASQAANSTGFGSNSLGGAANMSLLGTANQSSTLSGSLFGGASQAAATNFGAANAAPTVAANAGVNNGPSFQLQKPPFGNKRGKKS